MNRFYVVSAAEPPFSWRGLLRGWWVTNRMEYFPSAINEIGIPALLALYHRPLDGDFFLAVLGALAVWWLADAIGSSLNCLADYETDRLDVRSKGRITRAIDGIGGRRLFAVNMIEIAITTVLVAVLIWWRQRPLLMVFWLVGLAFSFAYSTEPMKFKRRGLLNALTLDTILYVCPMFFAYTVLSPVFHADAVCVILIFCLQMVPMFFVDEVSDYEEDVQTGMTNPCVRYGRYRISLAAFWVYAISSAAAAVALAYFWPPMAAAHYILYGLAVLCFAKVLFDFWRLSQTSQRIERAPDPKAADGLIARIKKQVTTPLWLMLTGIGVLLGLLAHLIRPV